MIDLESWKIEVWSDHVSIQELPDIMMFHKKTLKNKTRGKIQFNKIKWGSFTKIYNNYIKNHPTKKNELPDLKHFAKYVNKHPDQFNKKTHKKALFYTNILTHNG